MRQATPPEIRAIVETNALFHALRMGDYTAAAKAQERLRKLGWYLSRQPPRPSHRKSAPARFRPA